MDAFAQEYLRAIFILVFTSSIWLIIKLKHGHANNSLELIESFVKGYAMNALFWGGIIGLGILAAWLSYPSLLHATLLVLFSSVAEVTFIEISSTSIAIFWGIEKASNGHLDYRKHIVVIIAVATAILFLMYFAMNLPESPLSYP